MHQGRKVMYGFLSCLAMLVIILDGANAADSVQNALNMCLQTVIPALFPFFVFSGIVNSCFLGQNFYFAERLGRLCRIPTGTESLLLIGLISGYPVGAQLVSDAYNNRSITEGTAKRMLGFCSNAGPAFIFGILASAFTNPVTSWVLWAIHIVSALGVGWVLPGGVAEKCLLSDNRSISITKALSNAIRNIAMVCAWVILFRLLLDFCNRWFLWLLPPVIQVLIAGTIELTNGCIMLQQIDMESMRFIIASVLLAFGGFCVSMQTYSVAKNLRVTTYFHGKMLQMLFSATLSILLEPVLFPNNSNIFRSKSLIVLFVLCSGLVIYMHRRKKL